MFLYRVLNSSQRGLKIDDMGTFVTGTTINTNNNYSLLRNRLYHINDDVADGVWASDIDDMGAFVTGTTINTDNNYSYDEEGRLIRDVQEGIERIVWRVDGRVKEVIRTSTSDKKNLSFDYDAMGQRIAKHVYDNQTGLLEKTTYYLLDANGTCMNIYEHEVTDTDVLYTLKERHIYGSSSLGIKMDSLNMFTATISNNVTTVLGRKYYHLTNHLSNNLTTINDIKIPVSSGNNVDYFDVGIVNIYDYSPFGVQLDERSMESDYVRVGYQSWEKDDEIKGSGNHLSFGNYGYDPRTGRRWCPDPLQGKYPFLSSYSAFNNNPVIYKDVNGLDWEITVKFDEEGNKTIHVKITAAVLNSSATKVDMEKFQAAIKSQIETSYSVKWTEASNYEVKNLNEGLDRPPNNVAYPTEIIDVNVEVEVEIRTITDKKDLGSEEHLVEIVDDKNITSESTREENKITLGQAPFNGRYVKINALGVRDILNGTNKKTVPHEFGHTGGLEHPNLGAGFFGYFQSEQYMKDGTHDNNLMYQTGYQDNTLGNTGDGNELRANQIEILIRNFENGSLNQDNIPK